MTPGTAEKRWIAGVDLGGTNIVVGLIPIEGGEVLGLRTHSTDSQRGAKFVVDRIVGMVEEAIGEVTQQRGTTRGAMAGVGIGSPGPLDRKTGTVINTPIAPGQTVNVQFVLGVQVTGNYRFFVNIEALP